jgi:hypothetical protein
MNNNELLANDKLTDLEKQAIKDCEFEITDVRMFLEYVNDLKLAKENDHYVAVDGTKYKLDAPFSVVMSQSSDLNDEESELLLAKYKQFMVLRNSWVRKLKLSVNKKSNVEVETTQQRNEKVASTIMIAKKAIILELFSKLYTVKEVYIKLKDLGFKYITENLVSTFYTDNIDEIRKLQEKYKSDYTHLRLTSKTSRVEELTTLYVKLKSKYEKSNHRDDHKALIQTLDAIRKEVEGDKLTINGNLGIQIQTEVSLHVRQEMMKGVPLKEIIIGRLSARSGINPLNIISELNSSYYSKYNRLVSGGEEVDYEEVILPSLQVYDFEKIKSANLATEETLRREKIEFKEKMKQKALENQQEGDSVSSDTVKNNLRNILMKKIEMQSKLLSDSRNSTI